MSRKKKTWDLSLEYYLADYLAAAFLPGWQSQYLQIFKSSIPEWSKCQSRNKLDRRQ